MLVPATHLGTHNLPPPQPACVQRTTMAFSSYFIAAVVLSALSLSNAARFQQAYRWQAGDQPQQSTASEQAHNVLPGELAPKFCVNIISPNNSYCWDGSSGRPVMVMMYHMDDPFQRVMWQDWSLQVRFACKHEPCSAARVCKEPYFITCACAYASRDGNCHSLRTSSAYG